MNGHPIFRFDENIASSVTGLFEDLASAAGY